MPGGENEMNEILYYFSRIISVIFVASSILVAIEFYILRKGWLRSVFIFCVVAIVIIGLADAIFEINLDELACRKYEAAQQISERGFYE